MEPSTSGQSTPPTPLGKYALPFLGQTVTVTVDRAMGTAHPKHGWIYPVNYGEIANTEAPDGEGIDAYILGVAEPVATFTGTCIALIHRENDDDDKLVVVPAGVEMTDDDIRASTHFQEQFFTSDIVRPGAPEATVN